MPSVFIAKSLLNSRKAESLGGDAEAPGDKCVKGRVALNLKVSNPNKRRKVKMAREVSSTHPKQRGWLLCRARHNQRCRKWAERLGWVGEEGEAGVKRRVSYDGPHVEHDKLNGECNVKSNDAHVRSHTSNVTRHASHFERQALRHASHVTRNTSQATCHGASNKTQQTTHGTYQT